MGDLDDLAGAAMFSSFSYCDPSNITEVKPARMQATTVLKSVPWSRCRAMGTVAFSAAVFTMADDVIEARRT